MANGKSCKTHILDKKGNNWASGTLERFCEDWLGECYLRHFDRYTFYARPYFSKDSNCIIHRYV